MMPVPMPSEFPATVEEARGHILQIRHQRGLDRPDTDTSELEAALNIFSSQLYQKSTHFLLELIQNADDNTYRCHTPTLQISYHGGYLELTSNETGFSKRNVEALCRIGQSTKLDPTSADQYTGEKGIGFKSVFRVADVVWVRSGNYSFKFDRHERLGMIVPTWAEYPWSATSPFCGNSAPGRTSIALRLSSGVDPESLLAEIRFLDARVLLFLRRLRRIELAIKDETHWSSTLSRADGSRSSAVVNELQDHHGHHDQLLQEVVLQRDGSSEPYLVMRYPVQNLPAVPMRPGVRRSEIALAFPASASPGGGNEGKQPGGRCSQSVYSHLPIRDFGFRFIIQADFVLTASREDIDQSSPWNAALCQALPHALSTAIRVLKQSRLRYEWPGFFPTRARTRDCFSGLEESTKELLLGEPIMESLSSTLADPATLVRVPNEMHDDSGVPLLSGSKSDKRYLSQRYHPDYWPVIRGFGVREMTREGFLDDLSSLANDQVGDYRERPGEWHACLSAVLTTLILSSHGYRERILGLPLVPLTDSQWITGRAALGAATLAMEPPEPPLPFGISLMEVDPAACRSRRRKAFFHAMGIKKIAPGKVCEEISRMHADPRLFPRKSQLGDLVSQVRFLFYSGWVDPQQRELWFMTESGALRQGSDLYVDSDDPHSATRYLSGKRAKFHFANRAYIDWNTEHTGTMVQWLADNYRLSLIPRLAHYTVGRSFIFMDEFHFILEAFPALDILMLLRDHWSTYRHWIVPEESRFARDPGWKISRQHLVDRIAKLNVVCRGGGTSKLSQTALPVFPYLEDPSFPADFIELPDPDNEDWGILRYFRVLVGSSKNPEFVGTPAGAHLRRLQELQREEQTSVSIEEVSEQYSKLHQLAYTERQTIREAFVTQPLVYVPPSADCSLHGWLFLAACRWSGTECLRKTPQLSAIYPTLGKFFCTTLQLRDADLPCLADEVLRISPSDGLEYISRLFVAFSQHLMTNEGFISNREDLRRRLTTTSIFPVVAAKAAASYSQFDSLQTARKTDIWFIADLAHLRKCFEGIVPLLAVEPAKVQRMGHFLDALGLGERLLSKMAASVPEVHGEVAFDEGATRLIRLKARFISRLLPHDLQRREQIVGLLHFAMVYQAESITLKWSVKLQDGTSVTGRADEGYRAKLSTVDGSLTLFISKGQVIAQQCPIELVELLSEFCQIQDPKNAMLLQYILAEPDLGKVADSLDRRGVLESAEQTEGTESQQPRAVTSIHALRNGFLSGSGQAQLTTSDHEAMQSFLDDLDNATSIKHILARRWERNAVSELKPFLSRACMLEKQDVSLFLPQSDIDRVFRGSDHTNDRHEVAHFSSGLLTDEERHSRETFFYPAVVAVPRAGRPKFRMMLPAVNQQDTEVAFLGELHMSHLLRRHMGRAFRPEEAWSSRLRTRAGFRPYEFNEMSTPSTFTIEDTPGSFVRMLTKSGYRGPTRWAFHKTFHVDVITVESSLRDATFWLHPHQIETARNCYIESVRAERPSSISVLAIVFNIRHKPDVALFLDPWALYLSGYLDIRIESHSLARFGILPSHVILREPDKKRDSRCLTPNGGLDDRQGWDGKFVYQPLVSYTDFRLLHLYLGEAADALCGVLHVYSTTALPRFHALSYTWGAELKPYRLNTPQGTIDITASLDLALRAVRERDRSLLVWVDAVCIDQSNNHEKAAQIRLMRNIYQSASLLYGYLGPQADCSDEAIRTLLQIRTQELDAANWPSNLPPVPALWAGRKIPPQDNACWGAIDALFHRDWFRRAWITQEIVLASEAVIICGEQRVPWSHLFEALEICLKEGQALVEADKLQPGTILQATAPAFAIGQTRKLYSEGPVKRRHRLLTLLELFSHTKASLERDKIFGLLGLAVDADEATLSADYDSPFEDLIRRFATHFAVRGDVFELLYRAGSPSKSYGFSSWIPAWTRSDYPRTISNWYSKIGGFCASGDATAYASVSGPGGSVLDISGIVVDSVSTVGDATLQDCDMWTFVNSLHSLLESMTSYPTGESLDMVRVLLPIGNASRPHFERAGDIRSANSTSRHSQLSSEGNGSSTTVKWEGVMTKFSSIQSFLEFLRQPRDIRADIWKYWQTVSAFSLRLSQPRFFTTARGYAGLAPSAVQTGDSIVLLQGGAVPFVIRPRDGVNSFHELVGECYVHGMMHGEGIHLPNLVIKTLHFT